MAQLASNIVPLHREGLTPPRSTPGRKPTYKYTTQIAGAEEAMNTIRWEMYFYDVEAMAETIGVSVACLYAIRRGGTKWPRPKTFFGLIEYLGLEMHLSKRDRPHAR